MQCERVRVKERRECGTQQLNCDLAVIVGHTSSHFVCASTTVKSMRSRNCPVYIVRMQLEPWSLQPLPVMHAEGQVRAACDAVRLVSSTEHPFRDDDDIDWRM